MVRGQLLIRCEFCGIAILDFRFQISDFRFGEEELIRVPPSEHQAHSEYVKKVVERLEEAHTLLREQQMAVRQEDSEEPHLF